MAKKNDITEELRRIVKKSAKKNKKILLAVTDDDYASLSKIANELNITVPMVIMNVLKVNGIIES